MAGDATKSHAPETPAGGRDRRDQWLSVSRAADLLGITAHTLRDWTRRGVVPARRTSGGHRRYDRAEIERLLAATDSGAALDDVHARTQRLATVVDLSSAVFGKLDPGEVLRAVCEKLIKAMNVTGAAVSLCEPETNSVRTVADYNVDGTEVIGKTYLLDEYPDTARVLRERRPRLVNLGDPEADPREIAVLDEWGDKSLLMLPLVYQGESIGIAELIDSSCERQYSEDELALAEALCAQVAVAVHNANTFAQLQRQNAELKLLLDTGDAIASSVELQETLAAITESLTKALDVSYCDIYDYHEDEGVVEAVAYFQVAGTPTPPDYLGTRYLLEDHPDVVRCLTTRDLVEMHLSDPELSDRQRTEMRLWGDKSKLDVPLIHGGQVIGYLDLVETRYERRFSGDETRLVKTMANQAAIALKNAGLFAEVKRSLGEVAALQRVAAALVSANTIDEVLATLAASLREALDVYACEIYDYDPALERITFLTEDTLAETPDEGFRGWYETDEMPTIATAVGERRTTLNYLDDPELPERTRQELERWGDQASVSVPMVLKDRVVGVIYLCERRSPRRFSEDDLRVAETVAAQGAIALENARAYARERRDREQLALAHRRLQALFDLVGQLQGVNDETELLDIVGRVLGSSLEFQQWVVWLHDPETDAYHAGVTFGPNETYEEQLRTIVMPARVMDGLLADATPILASFFVDHLIHQWSDEEQSYTPGEVEGERADDEWNTDDTLLVPMIDQQGERLGYIEVYDPIDRQRPGEDIVRLTEIFASRAAISIKDLRLYRQLEQQAITDALTGLYNRRYLMQRLGEEVAKTARYGQPLSMLMIDIDDFKPFNDTYGHPQGDKLLVAVAETLLGGVREKVDIVARYGGEEFVVVLPSTPAGGAEVLAERLCHAVGGEEDGEQLDATGVAETIRVALESRRFEGYPNRRDVQVTVSVGVACCPEHGTSVDELIANSDKALYAAKALGKNRTCVFGV